ncbi:FAD/NAD(P)-binding domain-containing protein [Auriscalpium vulgare]|uniref:FAD/NAD(P)-binding domain-containing protein n=1 Tax=Auriscalpium vulgare TaxID=40419 RepID=A0ACB8S3X6_9AGAM|nr:FAD/NAD(P)-binding domain-containing protein [Auriscalpium vulgare]
MRSAIVPTLLALVASTSAATEHPFQVPTEPAARAPSRIAIIGAGAGGSSAAFWLAKAKERHGLNIEVDIYEKDSFIGGRSTTVHPYGDSSFEAIELGASIFVDINKNMWRASDEFNLTRYYLGDDMSSLGLWDGKDFLFTTGSWRGTLGGWVDNIKALWRYGYYAPTNTDKLVKNITDNYVNIYGPDTPIWPNMSDVVNAFDWGTAVSQLGSEYFLSRGISERFTYELIDAATRVNYAQPVETLHGLATLCSLATGGAAGIERGNWRVFENFVQLSGAKLLLNTTVSAIDRESSAKFTVTSDRGTASYSSVILAAPFHTASISLPSGLADLIPQQPYMTLHVTLLSTTAPAPNPAYFGLAPGAHVPGNIYSTPGVARKLGDTLEFNSISFLTKLRKEGAEKGTAYVGESGKEEWIVKVFSPKAVSDEWLADLFMGQVGWVLRKEFQPYPALKPSPSFPPVRLDRGLFYVNAFEPLLSTMETETIAARNVVDLLLHEEFDSGICYPAKVNETHARASDPSFVYGWDC